MGICPLHALLQRASSSGSFILKSGSKTGLEVFDLYRYEILQMKEVYLSPVRYGLICKHRQGSRWLPVAVAAPFSCDWDTLTALAEKCTRLQLPPEHLIDVVSDFVSQASLST